MANVLTKSILFTALSLSAISCSSTPLAGKQADAVISQFSMCNTYKNSVCKVDFNPQQEFAASSSFDPEVKIWRRSDGKIERTLVHSDGVPTLDFSDDGNYLATGSYDKKVRIWQVSNGQLVKTLDGHTNMIWGVVFSPDGKSLASVGESGNALLWDVDTNVAKSLAGHEGGVWGVAFSPDGKLLLTSGEDDTIKIWRVATGELVSTLTEHSGAVLSLAFSHDGKQLASGGDDYSIKIWDTTSWTVLHTLKGDSYSIYSLAFSPDDNILISGGRDKGLLGEFLQYHFDYESKTNDVSVRLWDVKTATLLSELNGHKDDVNSVVFSSDGKSFASSSIDGNVIFWNLAAVLNR